MDTYIDKKPKQQAIKAWYDLLAHALTPEEVCLVKLKFVDGELRRFCPKNIEDKITMFSCLIMTIAAVNRQRLFQRKKSRLDPRFDYLFN
ncbi:hypothetical protein H4J50_18620 [Colwellia sp. 6M3]|jgi:hypothetical protein|uniref:hypothetical protein n=1 Tax=Colwellia sp. 6M3 TaxID=2759849 RepID=UPI0015F5459A|nr:hypothetical protein [Colwellia sp. 6M3]MBA6418006.1 hypothetical protein [Colwellia sp. 6M3]|tara:strand:- start:242 stop:511 length:270 start_codon:yes stop_codon:yes gene_type:complete